MTWTKFFFAKIEKGIKKRKISRWFWIRWKSCEKMHQKKVRSKSSWTNMSKSEKSVFFCHVLLITFFGTFFQNFFIGFEISVKFCVFWHLFRFCKKKKFFKVILVLFSNFDCKCAGNGSKKRKIFFLWMYLRI